MLQTSFVVGTGAYTRDAVRDAVTRMAAEGWRPALRLARAAVLECARAPEPFFAASRLAPSDASSPAARRAAEAAGAAEGDLFFRGAEIFYLISKPRGRLAWMPRARATEAAAADAAQPEMELGWISPRPSAGRKALEEFTRHFTRALGEAGASRPQWRSVANDGLAPPRTEEKADGFGWSRPRLSLSALERSATLTEPRLLSLLTVIRNSGVARKSELVSAAGERAEPIERDLARLESQGWIARVSVVLCRQSGAVLGRAPAAPGDGGPVLLARDGARQCPHCGLTWEREDCRIAFVARPAAAREEVRAELTARLGGLGFSALWWRDPSAKLAAECGPVAPEPLILAGRFAGEGWLFFHSEGALSPAAAAAAQALRARHGLRRLVVIAPALDPAARLRLDQFLDAPLGAAPPPLYLPDLAAVESSLPPVLESAALTYAAARVRPLEEVSGYPLAPLLRTLYASPAKAFSANHAG